MNPVPFAAGHRPEDIALLAKHSFLAGIGPQDLGAFVELFDEVALPADATIFRQGDAADHMYFVLEGSARVLRGMIDVARIGPGDHLGEVAILGPHTRTTTVVTDTPVRLARLSRARFHSLGARHPRAALHFVEALAGGIAATMTALSEDVGLLLRQRSLPRRSMIRVVVSGRATEVGTGTPVGSLLPRSADGALVVAATIDRRAVSLETALTADSSVEPLTTASWEGRRVFRRSSLLLVIEAARRAAPHAVLTVGPRLGRNQLLRVDGALDAGAVAAIQREIDALVAGATSLREELWSIEEARAYFEEQGWRDAAALVSSYRAPTISLLVCERTHSLAFGPVVPTAAELSGLRVLPTEGGLLVEFGARIRSTGAVANAGRSYTIPPPSVSESEPPPPVRTMSIELEGWLSAMHVTSVGHFNETCVRGQVDEIVRVSEGFHEKNIVRLADAVVSRRARVVTIAGPSSSGKTTFIRRLKVQLEVNGIVPVHLSLDDYYVDREKTPRDEAGELDFESVDAIDLQLLRSHLKQLLAGDEVRLAHFDFPTGKSLPGGGESVVLAASNVLLVEGLHAGSPPLFADPIRDPVAADALRAAALRLFVHPATALPLDRVSAVLPDDVRLLRRIVRDRHRRGYTALETIARWPSVRRGEERWIMPFAAQADFVFDTSLVYEVAVLRVYAERYLLEVPTDAPEFVTAHRLRQTIDRFVPIYPDHVPPTSILREFIGGGFEG